MDWNSPQSSHHAAIVSVYDANNSSNKSLVTTGHPPQYVLEFQAKTCITILFITIIIDIVIATTTLLGVKGSHCSFCCSVLFLKQSGLDLVLHVGYSYPSLLDTRIPDANHHGWPHCAFD